MKTLSEISSILIRLSISALLIIVVFLHIGGAITVDSISVVLFVIIALLWFSPTITKYVDTIELWGNKITFRKIQDIQENLEKANLLAEPTQPTYLRIANDDPNLALAGLRIEIEKQLLRIATHANGLSTEYSPGIGRLIRLLSDKDILTPQERSALSELISILNSAVHGAEVNSRAASWAFEFGPQIIAALEQKYPGS